MAVVTGTIISSNPSIPISADIQVQAFDKDMRSEQLLGEVTVPKPPSSTAPVSFTITYTESRFRRNEKRSADLIVRAQVVDGSARGESGLIFNAPDEVLNLRIRLNPVEEQLSEFERLVNELTPLMEGVEPAALTDEDNRFLSREADEQLKRIQFWRAAAKLERETGIRVEAGYGWQRMSILPLTVERLLEEPPANLRRTLENAIAQNIIPNISQEIDSILARLDALQFETGRLVSHTFLGQLLNLEDDSPLANYPILAINLDAPESETLGRDITDGQGLFTITYILPRPDASDPVIQSRRLQLNILHPTTEERIAQVIVTASPGQEEVEEVRVSLPTEPDLSPSIDEFPLPASVRGLLRDQGIVTLADIRHRGGLQRLEGLDLSDAEVQRLEAHARLSTLSADINDNAVLIDRGFNYPLKIANTPRAEFVNAVAEIGELKAAELYAGARAQIEVLENVLVSYRTILANQISDTGGLFPGSIDYKAIEETDCGCEDCLAAVSPLAYLADLLDYTTSHVKLQTQTTPSPQFASINLAWLEDNLHQRFGDLPAECDAVEQRVRQIRICCEVLRQWIAAETPDPPEDPGFEDPSAQNLSSRTEQYRIATYRALLNYIGVPYEALRDAITGTEEKRQQIADRIGVLPEHLDDLFIDLDGSLSRLGELWLEQHFGLQSTLRDPLAPGQTPLLVTWRLEYLHNLWRQLDFPKDAYSDRTIPFIDPDLIGSDDFRQPQPGNAAFDLWQQRREWVDTQISAITETLTNEGFNAALIQVWGDPLPDLRSLGKALAELGSEALKAELDNLRLTPESLTRLVEIQEKVTAELPLEDEEIRDTVNILVQVIKRDPQRISTWITEEENSNVLLDPRIFWISLREPQEGEWNPEHPSDIPLIDPQTLPLKDMIEPTAGQAAIAVWQARQTQLEQDYEAIQAIRETDGFDAMLRLALGHPEAGDPLQHDLEQLQTNLASSDPASVQAAQAAITNDLLMTLEDFNRLMLVRTKSAEPEPTNRPTAEEWKQVYTLLTISKKKKHHYPNWLIEEDQPELNAYWKILKARLPRWRTTSADRQTWQQALRMRSSPPLIDPDLLNQADLIRINGVTEPPYSLWKERKDWVNAKRVALRTLREAAATPLDGLNAMFTDETTLAMPVLGVSVADFLELVRQQDQGETITPQLNQLTLEIRAFNYLRQIVEKLEGAIALTEGEWSAVDSILIQVAKLRRFAEWRQQEQEAELYLEPEFFKLNDAPSLPEWRATQQARRDWESTLQSRIDQVEATILALQEAVSATEEETLPLLRDALIKATSAEGNTPLEKARWITDHLLIDAEAGSCQITTRVSQAITTLQTLLWGIRTGLLREAHPTWVLDADQFDEEWTWIGSYATWRSAMFVFLYPENIAIPSLRQYQTPAFRQMVETVRNQRLTPEAACQAANAYSAYYQDVCNLSLESTCEARTRIHESDACQPASPEYRRLYYLFARSRGSRQVYWSTYDFRINSGYAQSFWQVIPGLENANQIIGAVPYAGYVFLFVIVSDRAGQKKLVFTLYDLELGGDWSAPQDIELPEGTLRSAVVAQRSSSTAPPLLVVNSGSLTENKLFWRSISLEQTEPKQEDEDENESNTSEWNEIEFTIQSQEIVNLAGLFKLQNGYCLILQHFDRFKRESILISHLFNQNFMEQNTLQPAFQLHGFWKGGWYWSGTNDLSLFGGDPTIWFAFRVTENFEYNPVFFDRAAAVSFTNLGSFATYSDDNESNVRKSIQVRGHSIVDAVYLSIIQRDDDNDLPHQFIVKRRIAIAPQVYALFDIPSKLKDSDKKLRRELIQLTYYFNEILTNTVFTYIQEAYYFVPIHLALQLQQTGHHIAALDWYRTVYDYTASSNQRKIYYGLKDEESFAKTFQRSGNWLLDPLNPHSIAATRANTYTRFTLLSIIRCLLEYADNEFTRDTAESVPRARVLYQTALDLLETGILKQQKDGCDQLIGSLEIEVGEAWLQPLQMILVDLGTIRNLAQLETVTGRIQQLAADVALNDEQKIFAMTAVIASAKASLPPAPTLSTVLPRTTEEKANAQMTLFANPLIAKTATEAVATAKTYLREGVASVTGISEAELQAGRGDLEWLRQPLDVAIANLDSRPIPVLVTNGASSRRTGTLETVARTIPGAALDKTIGNQRPYVPAPSFGFCIPPNPILASLRMRAELNLTKLRNCRNIAGIERVLEPYAAPTDTVSGLPIITGGQLTLPGLFTLRPTPYRYKVLIERAKELVQLSTQIEAAMLSALEKRDAEAYQVLRARQEISLTRAGIRLQDLRVREAQSNVTLASLQRDRAQIQFDTYQSWIDLGLTEWENKILAAYEQAKDAQLDLVDLSILSQIAQEAITAATADYSSGAALGALATFGIALGRETKLRKDIIRAEANAQIAQANANYERRAQEWEFQKSLAQQDILIGDQQIVVATQQVDVVEQEREIAVLQAEHAQETLDFLVNKFTNVELYDWMSNILEGVYSYFLQQATSMAKLAESQLAFERQQIPPAFIQADYWDVPDATSAIVATNENSIDRRGLTGSARLLQDIYKLDQYAFETDQRKLQLTKTISLARLAPVELQRFRETGVITFATPMELFDRDFPGHYLRLIQQVRTSVVALIPPTQGIKATLSTTGTSRVVIGGDIFQTVMINRGPESVALTSPLNATGLFELNPQPEMLLPFEGLGIDTTWEFRMPKPSNLFNYSTIADVLITLEYTALNSYDYRQQVIQQLDPTISADRSFVFTNDLADQWYDLNNPDQTTTPMVVRFSTRPEDFPSNVQDLKIQQVVLYFVRQDGADFEVPVTHLRFTERNSIGTVGGGAQSIDGIISTRRGNAASWTAMIGKLPFGDWELALLNELDDGQRPRELFENEEIEDILFIITYAGRTPEWPV